VSRATGEWRTFLLSVALVPILSTCGSSSGSSSCGKLQPCGGDIVGNWTIADACVSNTTVTMQVGRILSNCPSLTATASGVHATGSVSFNTDLTYTVTETLTTSGQATIPASCLQSGGTTLTCAQLDQRFQQIIAANSMDLQSAHCSGSGSCVCDVTLAPMTTNETGTYVADGVILNTTNTANVLNIFDYCVQKNDLHMILIDGSTDAMGNLNITADTVFKKN